MNSEFSAKSNHYREWPRDGLEYFKQATGVCRIGLVYNKSGLATDEKQRS